MAEPEIEVEILRYRPETDDKPSFQTYRVPYDPDWVVLDAVNYIKDHLDGTLSYRWSCHMAVCGSCGMMINGEPTLSCHAFLRDYYPGKLRIEPLANFPIERDLVVVIDDFMDKLESVSPYLMPEKDEPTFQGEYIQLPFGLKKFKQFTLCINCLLCYSACPQYGLNPEFVGPAALTTAHRYDLDTRDVGREHRKEVVASKRGVWECTFVGACSEVCPKDVDPAAAIQESKLSYTIDYFKSYLLPKGKR